MSIHSKITTSNKSEWKPRSTFDSISFIHSASGFFVFVFSFFIVLSWSLFGWPRLHTRCWPSTFFFFCCLCCFFCERTRSRLCTRNINKTLSKVLGSLFAVGFDNSRKQIQRNSNTYIGTKTPFYSHIHVIRYTHITHHTAITAYTTKLFLLNITSWNWFSI